MAVEAPQGAAQLQRWLLVRELTAGVRVAKGQRDRKARSALYATAHELQRHRKAQRAGAKVPLLEHEGLHATTRTPGVLRNLCTAASNFCEEAR